MQFNIKLIEKLETDTGIEWWNVNREKINEVIELHSDWQINHRQDCYRAELVLAKVKSVRKWSEDRGSKELGGWQIEILNEIEEHVESVIEE